jgi:hypothetical protein
MHSPPTDEEAAIEQMMQSLIDFGLAKTTARRLAGLPHVTPDVVARWLRYCQLRGPDSFRNPNVFLLTRLNRNDYPAPSWSALQWLEQRLKQEEQDATQQEEA